MAKKAATSGVSSKARYVWAVMRIALGLVFLWPFADKMVGLGFSTCRSVDANTKVETVQVMCSKAVAKGNSPTKGFLKGSKGPFKTMYNNIAGNKLVDTLFMAGLLLIGLALISGAGMKVATVSGALMMMLMWTAAMPPTTNPVLDDHIIYALALIGLNVSNSEQVWGLGKWWAKKSIVKKYPILQ